MLSKKLKKTLRNLKKILKIDNSHFESLKLIAYIYSELGNYRKSVIYYKKLIKQAKIKKNVFWLSIAYSDLSWDLFNYNKTKQALKAEKIAIKYKTKLYGTHHPEIASSYNNIGGILTDLEDFDKALVFYKKALDIDKKLLGFESINTAEDLNNIGGILYEKGEYKKALSYYKKALTIDESILGKKHEYTLSDYSNIEYVYYALDNKELAMKYHEKYKDNHTQIP